MPQESVSRTFEEALAFGEDGEHVIGQSLLDRGCVIMPLYQFRNHDAAPVLFFGAEHIVLPDLMVWDKERKCFFVECKRKTRWVTYKYGTETGFNDRLLNHYDHVQRMTGHQVNLVFLHEGGEPTGRFVITLDNFKQHARYWDGRNDKGGGRVSPPMRLVHIDHLRRVEEP